MVGRKYFWMGEQRTHSFAATNPCHVYELARELWRLGRLGRYYSGYPGWRLGAEAGFPLVGRSWRTLVTYGFQRMPEKLRPHDEALFRWQDAGFDRAVGRVVRRESLGGGDFLHGLPGQCLELFEAGHARGRVAVLNHAMGPLEQQRKLVAPEYERAGLVLAAAAPLPDWYLERLRRERELADVHCVASSVVRDQLVADGVAAGKIWVVPYGADGDLFRKREREPEGPFRVCFAGRQSLRKGIHYLLRALETVGNADWELHCFGMAFRETAGDFAAYGGAAKVRQRGSLSRGDFAAALREMDLLVLPSAEEAFGLVVVQALQVGVPCVVSERVGAKDLIREGETGSVVAFGDVEALGGALADWSKRRMTVRDEFPWSACAERLLAVSAGSGV